VKNPVHVLVTGGAGFLGSALVRRLLKEGRQVRVLDNGFRSSPGRLADVLDQIDLVQGDICRPETVDLAVKGVDCVVHLAAINGTENFYRYPQLVLDVGLRGTLNVVDACKKHRVSQLLVASSSEVYQNAPVIPTDETVPLVVPNVLNPRYSYGGSKIAAELIAINYGRTDFERVVIFRPHNVYGPDMGWEHVLPQFILRALDAIRSAKSNKIDFEIQGDGSQTRAFTYIDDLVDGLMLLLVQGKHLNVYNIGNPQEITMLEVAAKVLGHFGREPVFVHRPLPEGSAPRRCPDIRKLQALGFEPKISFDEGLPPVVAWYTRHAGERPKTERYEKRISMTKQLSSLDSKAVTQCQNCGSGDLKSALFFGFVPPVNEMHSIDSAADVEMRFPLELLRCTVCTLVQIGYEVDPRILFPYTYPYLSGTTRILRENFKDLADEAIERLQLNAGDLAIDVGANDGTLLSSFRGRVRVAGIEPSQAADKAIESGIPMIKDYFDGKSALRARQEFGPARVVTATNVFAHIAGVHSVVEQIKSMLAEGGIFISESHYLLDLVNTLQYDAIYHEHLRYYSLRSLWDIVRRHGLEIIYAKRIPTHGGSIRVYTAPAGQFSVDESVQRLLDEENRVGLTNGSALLDFRSRVIASKLELMKLLDSIKRKGVRVYGIGAPSRASTLINYCGLDDGLIDCVVEVSSSHKINKFIPGTRIPVLDEQKLYRDQPEYALLFSWHITKELVENLRRQGFKGQFITPLPDPKIIS
jgi:nucleoside-diphosphate-sugar epimerase